MGWPKGKPRTQAAAEPSVDVEPVRTNALTLVSVWTPEHVEWLRKHRSLPALYKYFRQDAPICKEAQNRWWRTLDQGAVRLYLVNHAEDGYIGYVGFNPISFRSGRAEFGMFIIPKFQGTGYGKKSMMMLLKKGFEDFNLSTIYSDVIDYPGENRFDFYRKLGFEAHPPASQNISYMKQGVRVPSIKFFMTRDTWEKIHGANGNGGLESVAQNGAAKDS